MSWLTNEAVARLREVAVLPGLAPGRYELRQPIGRGGMGVVYAAHDCLLGREVALKVSNAVAADGALDRRLEHEARLLARLEHPGIVPVHDAGRLDDGRLFYVMKLVRGDTLEAHRAALASEASRLAVFERLTETVAFAHAAGVIHRDLKPSNVMVGRFGEVLVLDWGVARAAPAPAVLAQEPSSTPASGAATAFGTRIGTAGFMAPEQARGEVAGPAADVYALGALLLWLLTGSAAAPPDEARRRLEALTPPPSRRLRAIVLKALDLDASRRYPTAAELLADVTNYRAGAAVTAHREHALERLGRWLYTYRTFVLLVLAYLLMRAVFAFWTRR